MGKRRWIPTIPSLYLLYPIMKDLINWIMEKYPMNVEIFAFRIIIILSICYGLFILITFFYKLNKKITTFIDGSKDPVFHKWLSDHPDWQYRASGSFEDRVIVMTEWLKTIK